MCPYSSPAHRVLVPTCFQSWHAHVFNLGTHMFSINKSSQQDAFYRHTIHVFQSVHLTQKFSTISEKNFQQIAVPEFWAPPATLVWCLWAVYHQCRCEELPSQSADTCIRHGSLLAKPLLYSESDCLSYILRIRLPLLYSESDCLSYTQNQTPVSWPRHVP
jgi:hypothetical protein